jgi:hypothetical protein
MSDTQIVEKSSDLAHLGNVVPDGYQYYEKMIAPGEALRLPNAYLKWYDLYPDDAPITPEQGAETRAFIQAEVQAGRLKFQDELGFVILHRAGSYLLLMVMTWRNTNEIWESVYFRELTQTYQPTQFDSGHRGTFCVWELGAVWHERHAWVRFLSSKRDVQAKLDYVNDLFSGRV